MSSHKFSPGLPTSATERWMPPLLLKGAVTSGILTNWGKLRTLLIRHEEAFLCCKTWSWFQMEGGSRNWKPSHRFRKIMTLCCEKCFCSLSIPRSDLWKVCWPKESGCWCSRQPFRIRNVGNKASFPEAQEGREDTLQKKTCVSMKLYLLAWRLGLLKYVTRIKAKLLIFQASDK